MPEVTEFAGFVGLSTASCGTLAMISNLTDQEEARQAIPWAITDAPADFTEAPLSAIIEIELAVTKLSGKWKVSQNQPDENRSGVRSGLKAQSNLDSDRLIE